MNSDYDRETHRRPPEYSGEDTRLTSRKELSGWYSYGWAAEVYVICGVGIESIALLSDDRKLNVLALRRFLHPYHSGTAGA